MWKKTKTFQLTLVHQSWICLDLSPKSKVLDLSHQKDCCNACSTTSTASGFLLREKPAPVSLAGKNWGVLLQVPIIVALFIHPKCPSEQQHEKTWPGKQLFSQQHVHQLYHQNLAVRFLEEWQLYNIYIYIYIYIYILHTNISFKKDVFFLQREAPCPPYPTPTTKQLGRYSVTSRNWTTTHRSIKVIHSITPSKVNLTLWSSYPETYP